jgi:hypothetical protein
MNTTETRECPSLAEGEPYWKSMWVEKTQHNEKEEWIKIEERRKISNIDRGPIKIMEITSFLSKLTTGNLLEILKYKISSLEHSQLPTGILQKTYAKLEEIEKEPDWLTT